MPPCSTCELLVSGGPMPSTDGDRAAEETAIATATSSATGVTSTSGFDCDLVSVVNGSVVSAASVGGVNCLRISSANRLQSYAIANEQVAKAVAVKQRKSMSPFTYISQEDVGIVWINVIIFAILHLFAVVAYYLIIANKSWYTWLFHYFYGTIGGLGVTAGAHRLWSHKAYKAKVPLRVFLMIGHCIAGQNDLFTWCRDHRVHHKYSDTDADPHNSGRGFFFAHVGWLMTKKHPEVLSKGKLVNCDDLLRDPVVAFQKSNYLVLFLLFTVVLPTLIPVILWDELWLLSMLFSLWRYTTALHCTWFVNSAAHMWGDRPYNQVIGARENHHVSFLALGEGFHNYHHTFPWDYATSEMGYKYNFSKFFIDTMARLGQAHDLKTASSELVHSRKLRTGDGTLDVQNEE